MGDELDGATADEEVVVNHAADGDHSEAAILELGELAAGEGVGVGAAVEGVKAEVAGLAVRAVEGLDDGGDTRDDLKESEPDKELLHGALLDGRVVELHHGGGAELLLEAGEGVGVLDDHSGGGEHGNAAVLDLSLASPAEVEEVGEAKGVESNIANESAVEVAGAAEAGDGLNAKALHERNATTRQMEVRGQFYRSGSLEI